MLRFLLALKALTSNFYAGRPFPYQDGLFSKARTHVGRRPFVILTNYVHYQL